MDKYCRIDSVDYQKVKATFIMNDGTEYIKEYQGTYRVWETSPIPSIYGTHAEDVAMMAFSRSVIEIDKHTLIYPCNVKKIVLGDPKPNTKRVGFWKEYPKSIFLKIMLGKEFKYEEIK